MPSRRLIPEGANWDIFARRLLSYQAQQGMDDMNEFEDESDDSIEIPNSRIQVEPCWPFWGLLETVRSEPRANQNLPLGVFNEHIIFRNPRPDIFECFSNIATRALRMLKLRDLSEFRDSAAEIHTEIETEFELYVERESQTYIEELLRKGGWELDYLPKDTTATKYEIENLLENWSENWPVRTNWPTRSNFDNLRALQDCLDFSGFDQQMLIHFGLMEPEEHSFFAVFALMIICEAVHSDTRTKINNNWLEPTASQIKSMGQATIKAIEALAYAESLQLEQEIRKSIDLKQPEILEKELSRRTSERAAKAANKKHFANNKAKIWVCEEWELYREHYSGNKSDFSRIYAKRIFNEFTDLKGAPLKVTEKTIREVWLRNTPNASK